MDLRRRTNCRPWPSLRRGTATLLGALGLLAAGSALAEPPTLDWRLPLPAGQGWRINDLREGNGIPHEE